MTDVFLQFDPVMQAFIATLFTWGVTAAGAAVVFFKRAVNEKLMDAMLGFAAGVMIAASFLVSSCARHRDGEAAWAYPMADRSHRIYGLWDFHETD